MFTETRDGFTKGDKVTPVTPPRPGFPTAGVVQGWHNDGTGWYCSVTWGGKFPGRYQAAELRHA